MRDNNIWTVLVADPPVRHVVHPLRLIEIRQAILTCANPLFQISVQRLGARISVRENLAGPLHHPGLSVVARAMPDPFAAETGALREDNLGGHPAPSLAGEGGERLDVKILWSVSTGVQYVRRGLVRYCFRLSVCASLCCVLLGYGEAIYVSDSSLRKRVHFRQNIYTSLFIYLPAPSTSPAFV